MVIEWISTRYLPFTLKLPHSFDERHLLMRAST